MFSSRWGRALTTESFEKIRTALQDTYEKRGFILVLVEFPAQRIGADRSVTLVVHTPTISKGSLQNVCSHDLTVRSTLKTACSALEQSVVQRAIGGEHAVLTVGALDHTIELLDVVSGDDTLKERAKATLYPGSTPWSTAVKFYVPTPDTFEGSSVAFDNWGSPYTGEERVLGQLSVHDMIATGDTLSVLGSVSGMVGQYGRPGLEYGTASYMLPVDSYGTRAGLILTALSYNVLGATTPAFGNAYIIDAEISQPVWLTLRDHVFVQMDLDYYDLTDSFGSGYAGLTDARTVPDIVVSLYGKHEKNLKHGERSAVFKDSTFNWMLSATIGSVDFSNAEAESTDAATLKTGGFFYKGDLSLTERFSLTDDSRLSLQFLSYSQLSSKNLDPSQQLVIGGPESVPAYASGIFNGSQGSYEMVTLDDVLWSNSRGDSFFSMGPLYAFGYIDVDRFYVPSTTSNNSAIMEGPGVEATLRVGRLTGAVSMAVPVGAIPDIVSNSIPGAFNFNAAGSAPIQVWGRLSYVF